MSLLLIHKSFRDPIPIPGIEHVSNIDLYSGFIREEIRTKNFCEGLNHSYIDSSLRKADYILLFIDNETNPVDRHGSGVLGDMLGFATLNMYIPLTDINENNLLNKLKGGGIANNINGEIAKRMSNMNINCLYVDIFCTLPGRGIGTLLMGYIDFIKDAYGFSKICLCSLENAIQFYEKQGFLIDFDLSDDICGPEMPFMLRGGIRRNRHKKGKTCKSRCKKRSTRRDHQSLRKN